MSNIKGSNKKQVYMLDEDTIDVEQCVNARLEGKSFDDLSKVYGVTKIVFYGAWNRLKERNAISYRPIPLAALRRSLADPSVSFTDIAMSYGCSVQGLQNYIADQGIPPRKVDMERVSEMLGDGMSIPACAEYYGVSYLTMYSACKKAGLVSERSKKLEITRGNDKAAKTDRLKERIAELEAEVDSLRKRIAELEAEG